ncbi:(d)CMP kinase [Geobacter sp. DSM 9736]|uniref:(d)CMP kinase n=1 Tax=Geobacter sp. DSM 9736 TaxID=1277350 RepID=UPI000B50024F|nr:(d)CMP kinase [Geobacter sp. DSM 9736]
MNGKNGRGLIIAIDGPSGAGKSTVTKLLADRLGYIFLDTGAMFRAVALAAQRAGISVEDDDALANLCRGIAISFERRDGCCCRVMLNDEDVSSAIRSPEISLLTSRISARKVVREFLLTLQREMGSKGGVILEGRDIGTVVFPDADVKVFLSASAEVRGKRRFIELKAKGVDVDLETTVGEVMQRDEQDVRREHAPLRQAEDAIVIDSTELTVDDVVDTIEKMVAEKLRA